MPDNELEVITGGCGFGTIGCITDTEGCAMNGAARDGTIVVGVGTAFKAAFGVEKLMNDIVDSRAVSITFCISARDDKSKCTCESFNLVRSNIIACRASSSVLQVKYTKKID